MSFDVVHNSGLDACYHACTIEMPSCIILYNASAGAWGIQCTSRNTRIIIYTTYINFSSCVHIIGDTMHAEHIIIYPNLQVASSKATSSWHHGHSGSAYSSAGVRWCSFGGRLLLLCHYWNWDSSWQGHGWMLVRAILSGTAVDGLRVWYRVVGYICMHTGYCQLIYIYERGN